MRKQAQLKSDEASNEQQTAENQQTSESTKPGGRKRQKRESSQELPVPKAIASLAISALAIGNSVDTILRKAGADIGLADWALLQALSTQTEPQLMGKLGIDMGVTRQRIQKQIDELKKSGLVSVSTTAEDKRSRHVALTPAGQKMLEATADLWAQQLYKTDTFADLKSQSLIQRRVERIASLLSRLLRSEIKASVADKKAQKASTETQQNPQ
jgi:DNA-binding MarR family transcriptional regulator